MPYLAIVLQSRMKTNFFLSTRERVDAGGRTRLASFLRGFYYRSTPSRLKGPLYVLAFFSQQNPRLFPFQFPVGTKNSSRSEYCNTSRKIITLLNANCLKKIVHRKALKTRVPVLSSPKTWVV